MSSNPTPRVMTTDEVRAAFVSVGQQLLLAIVCCYNCDHFKSTQELCGLNNRRPPAKVMCFGCECFKANNIPF